jgi:hypothetical protein
MHAHSCWLRECFLVCFGWLVSEFLDLGGGVLGITLFIYLFNSWTPRLSQQIEKASKDGVLRKETLANF